MSKHILVISTSPRKGGNSETLADAFIKGIEESGNTAEKIVLYDKTIGFCKGCLACQKTRQCIIRDDAKDIVQKMCTSDVIAFATPIYYYEMCGQMKTMLDRANPLYSSDYMFRDIYMLSAAAEDEDGVDRRAVSGLEGWIECFEKAHLAGTVFAGGVSLVGDIKDHPTLIKAYEMGKNI